MGLLINYWDKGLLRNFQMPLVQKKENIFYDELNLFHFVKVKKWTNQKMCRCLVYLS